MLHFFRHPRQSAAEGMPRGEQELSFAGVLQQLGEKTPKVFCGVVQRVFAIIQNQQTALGS
jgi:hypothetical protein